MTLIAQAEDRTRRAERPIGMPEFIALAATLVCMVASSMPMMLAARAAADVFAAGSRVIAVSVVRDRFVGDRMARVMSIVFMVFILVPVAAPAFGQGVLVVADWRWIFGSLF